MSGEARTFPIQKDSVYGPTGKIPWQLAELAYEAYAAAGHGSQSLERLAERSGFSWEELVMLLRGPAHYRSNHLCNSKCWSPKG